MTLSRYYGNVSDSVNAFRRASPDGITGRECTGQVGLTCAGRRGSLETRFFHDHQIEQIGRDYDADLDTESRVLVDVED